MVQIYALYCNKQEKVFSVLDPPVNTCKGLGRRGREN